MITLHIKRLIRDALTDGATFAVKDHYHTLNNCDHCNDLHDTNYEYRIQQEVVILEFVEKIIKSQIRRLDRYIDVETNEYDYWN